MPAPQNVLVLGVGELDMSILHAFAKARDPTRARVAVMLRPELLASPDESKQRDHAVTVAQLAAAIASFDRVINCTGFSAGTGAQVQITQAVLAARVKRFVPWQFGLDYDRIGHDSAQDLFDEKLQVRDLLRSQHGKGGEAPATQWKIISTGSFCSFLFEPWFGIEDTVTATTVEDIGTLTVQVVLSPDTEWNNVTLVAGDAVTYGQLAQLVQEAVPSDVSVRTEVWSSSHFESELLKDLTNAICKYRVVFEAGVGISWDKQGSWNERHGIEATTIGQWLAVNPSVLVHQEVEG